MLGRLATVAAAEGVTEGVTEEEALVGVAVVELREAPGGFSARLPREEAPRPGLQMGTTLLMSSVSEWRSVRTAGLESQGLEPPGRALPRPALIGGTGRASLVWLI